MSESTDDIIKQLAEKFSGLKLKEDEPPPRPAAAPPAPTRDPWASFDTERRSVPSADYSAPPKLFPSQKMELRSGDSRTVPKRPPVTLNSFPLEGPDSLDELLKTPTKRSWQFQDWLEVIGLPRDLHEFHDKLTYAYAGKAFLQRKQECHRHGGESK